MAKRFARLGGCILAALGLASPARADILPEVAVPAGKVAALAEDDASGNSDVYGEDIPLIQFGRAVDLAGEDIEPLSTSAPLAGLGTGLVPSGRPLSSSRLTSGFGFRTHPLLGGRRFHAGIDLAAAHGTPIRATSAGRVVTASRQGAAGNLVVIDHGSGVETRYAHLSAFAVSAGQSVGSEQVIGYVGSTGRSTGPHLHYETRVAGRPVNPVQNWRR